MPDAGNPSPVLPGATTTIGTVTPSIGYALESIAFQPTTGNLYGLMPLKP